MESNHRIDFITLRYIENLVDLDRVELSFGLYDK